MSDPFVRNALKYAGAILIGALAAGLGALMVQLAGTDPIVWRPVFAAALGPIVTGLLARQLTRAGSEGIAAQVNNLRDLGYRREDMTVTAPRPEPVPITSLSDADIDRVTRRGLELMRESNPLPPIPRHPTPPAPMDRPAYTDQAPPPNHPSRFTPPPVPEFDWNKG